MTVSCAFPGGLRDVPDDVRFWMRREDMRYSQTREESAEILRAALTSMGQQAAAFHPPNYTIWYEHLAGVNPELTRVLQERLAAGEPLTDSDVAHLHAQHVLARDTLVFERLEERFRVLLEEILDAATGAEQDTSRFGSSLEEHALRLERPVADDLLRSIVAELLSDTRQMCAATTELSQQLERSAGEIRTLTQRLEQAQSEALRDPLTGLYNRRGFARAVDEVAGGLEGLAGTALLVIDIDHFKRINDGHGHLLGDKVLRAVALIIRANSMPRGVASRLGGEEFALLMPDTGLDAALEVAERLREAVAALRLKRTGQSEYVGNVTVSVGVARARVGEGLERLLERADAALCRAKHAGRNRVQVAIELQSE